MKLKFILPILIFPIIIFYSCVEEPTIDPVKAPYSVLRIANFLFNVDAVKITIDGLQPDAKLNNLAKADITGYFDVKSGKRKIKIVNTATNEVIFDKEITILSYERTTLMFAGNFSTVDTLNTFAYFTFDEGEVYVSGAPKTDKANIYLVHASPDSPTKSALKLAITAIIDSKDTVSVTTTSAPLEFTDIKTLKDTTAGNYKFTAIAGTDTLKFEGDVTKNMRTYFFLWDRPESMKVLKHEIAPLPVRPK